MLGITILTWKEDRLNFKITFLVKKLKSGRRGKKNCFPSGQIQHFMKACFFGSTELFLLGLQMKVSNQFPSSHIFAFVTFVSSLTIVNSFSYILVRSSFTCAPLLIVWNNTRHLKWVYCKTNTEKSVYYSISCNFEGKSAVIMCSHLLLFKIPGCFMYFGPLLSLKASHTAVSYQCYRS